MKTIIFQKDLHKKIINGKKTQTRRIPINRTRKNLLWDKAYVCGPSLLVVDDDEGKEHPFRLRYKVGDIVGIRECVWCNVLTDPLNLNIVEVEYTFPIQENEVRYFSEYEIPAGDIAKLKKRGLHLRSSIHMFDWMIRSKIKITRAWWERINRISETDCCKEGVVDVHSEVHPYRQFKNKWNEINGSRGDGGWGFDNNRYVECYEFKRA